MLLFLVSAFANPESVTVSYTATFDLDATGDQLCAITKFCDCKTTYAGTGKKVTAEGDRLTFEGTWKIVTNTCSDQLTVWVPPDGKAFHTLRHANGTLTEWVVHGDAAKNARMASGMKAGGQYGSTSSASLGPRKMCRCGSPTGVRWQRAFSCRPPTIWESPCAEGEPRGIVPTSCCTRSVCRIFGVTSIPRLSLAS